MPAIDVLASNLTQTRNVTIQVKAKFGGSDWQTSTKRGVVWPDEAERAVDDGRFWALVDLRPERPSYYVMPERWIQHDIWTDHAAYLSRNGGTRVKSAESTHHKIGTGRVDQWIDCWDLLGIFPLI